MCIRDRYKPAAFRFFMDENAPSSSSTPVSPFMSSTEGTQLISQLLFSYHLLFVIVLYF